MIPNSAGEPETEGTVRRIFEPGKDTKVHTAKWDRCVRKVKAQGGDANAYAICTGSVPYSQAFRKASRMKKGN